MTEEESEKRERKLQKLYQNPRKKLIQKIKINFEMLEHGWINLFIDFSYLRLKIWLSSVFDPLPEIITFYYELENGSQYSILQIDEEGIFKIIEVFKQDDDSTDIFVLKITSRGLPQKKGYDEYEVIKTISLRIFLDELKNALIDLANKNTENVWCNYNISEFLIEKINGKEKSGRPTTGSS